MFGKLRRQLLRRAFATVAGGASLALLTTGLMAAPAAAWTGTLVYVNSGNLGQGIYTSNAVYAGASGQCPMKPGYDTWHWVASPGAAWFDDSEAATKNLSYSSTLNNPAISYSTSVGGAAATLPAGTPGPYIDLSKSKQQAWSWTPHLAQQGTYYYLKAGSAFAVGGTKFVLSHTCIGTAADAPAPSPSQETTTVATSAQLTGSAVLGAGGTIKDVATVTGSPTTPTGSVTFSYTFNATGTPSAAGPFTNYDTKTLSVGTATSSSFTPTKAGTYLLHAEYTPDSGSFAGSFDSGANETITISRAVPSVATVASNHNANVNDTVTDAVTVTGLGAGFPAPTGTVTFTYCYNSTDTPTSCTVPSGTLGTVQLTNGQAASPSLPLALPGYYRLHAVYNGDSNYTAAADPDGGSSEIVRVVAATPPTLVTQVSSDSVTVNTAVTDVATLAHLAPNSHGYVTFSYCYSASGTPSWASCSGSATIVSIASITADGSGNASATSGAVTPGAAGKYLFHAAYTSIDGLNPSLSDNGVNELVTVSAPPVVKLNTTTVTRVSSTTVAPGQSVFDSVTVTDSNGQPVTSGTVTFQLAGQGSAVCRNGQGNVVNCNSGQGVSTTYTYETVTVNVALDANGTAWSTQLNTAGVPLAAGAYLFHAVYNGDSMYYGSEDNGANESFTVVAQSTTTTTSATPGIVSIGQSISDTATITGTSTAPTGNVTFSYCFSNVETPTWGTCTPISLTTSDSSTSGLVMTAHSSSIVASQPGWYLFHAAYAGDATHGSSEDAGTNEMVFVNGAPTAIVTQVSSESTRVGTTVQDVANLTGLTPSQTDAHVTFAYCYSATLITQWSSCPANSTVALPDVSLTAGHSDTDTVRSADVTVAHAGYYLFHATLVAADGTHLGSVDSSVGELVHVLPALTTTVTQISSDSVTVGAVLTDTVTVTSAAGTPTGSVVFTYCFSATAMPTECTTPTGTLGTKSLVNGVAVSAPLVALQAGFYLFHAGYLGTSDFLASADNGDNETVTVSNLVLENKRPSTTVTSVSQALATVGDTVWDVADVTSVYGIPTGSVTFSYCYNAVNAPTWGDCSAAALSTNTLSSGSAASDSLQLTKPGYYLFHASYAGDMLFEGSEDAGTNELVHVTAMSTTTTTHVSKQLANTGDTITDSVIVTANAGADTPTGTVTFYVCYSASPIASWADCANAPQLGSPVTLVDGAATSADKVVDVAGYYLFHAVYSGYTGPSANEHDVAFESSVDDGTNERVHVTDPAGPTPPPAKSPSTTVTQLSVNSSKTGDSVTDIAHVTSAVGTPTGLVTFYYCYSASVHPTWANCSNDAVQLGAPVALSNGSAKSTSLTVKKGFYLFHAVYGGDWRMLGSDDRNADGKESLEVTDADTTPTPPTPPTPPTNDPKAQDDKYTTYCTAIYKGPSVLGNDNVTDPKVSLVTSTAHGRLTLNPDGTFTYVSVYPSCAKGVTETFTYKVTDAKGKSVTAVATITIKPAGDIPRIIDTGSRATSVTATATVKTANPAAVRMCPSTNVGGASVGSVDVGNLSVPIKKVSYPAGGVLDPPPSAKIAAVSTLHRPLSATEGTTLITWHIRFNYPCFGSLNVLLKQPMGSTFDITDGDGNAVTYKLTEKHTVLKGDYKPEWFRLYGPRQITLVTCAGLVNGKYLKNTVLIAVPVTA